MQISLSCRERYGLARSQTAKVEDISVGAQQRRNLSFILYHGADILIDEPYCSANPAEIFES